MQELCLAIVLLAAAVSGVEYVATVAVSCTTKLVLVDDLEDMLDLEMDRPELDFDGEVEDSEPPASAGSQ